MTRQQHAPTTNSHSLALKDRASKKSTLFNEPSHQDGKEHHRWTDSNSIALETMIRTKHHLRSHSKNSHLETLPPQHHQWSHSNTIDLQTMPPPEHHQRSHSHKITLETVLPTKHNQRSESHNIALETMTPTMHHQRTDSPNFAFKKQCLQQNIINTRTP